MANKNMRNKKNVSTIPSKSIYGKNVMAIGIVDKAKKISINHYSNGKEWNSYIPNTKVNRDAIEKRYGKGEKVLFRGKKVRVFHNYG